MKKIRLFIFSFLILIQNELLALLPEFEQIYPMATIVSQNDFLERFEKNECIGAGGESYVFKVTEKNTKKEYALVMSAYQMETSLSQKLVSKTTAFVERMINLQQYNPHQAVIHAFFRMKTKIDSNYTNSIKLEKSENFYNELTDEQYELLPNTVEESLNNCFLLELGEADCENKKYLDLKIEPDLRNITIKMSTYFIQLAKIMEQDNKSRNYVYVKSEKVFYGERPMSDYAYWHYVIGNEHFYIPKLPVVIKRIDYSPWFLKEQGTVYYNYMPRIDFSSYLKYKNKPEISDDQILDILVYIP